jgi:hypothetical protein
MDDVADDARLFVYGISSRYFAEVVDALRAELAQSDPLQAQALDTLCERLRSIRDLLEQRLRDLRAEALKQAALQQEAAQQEAAQQAAAQQAAAQQELP